MKRIASLMVAVAAALLVADTPPHPDKAVEALQSTA